MEVRQTEIVVDGVRAPVLETGPPSDEEAILFVHQPGLLA
jgi:hypothetical protein